MDGQTILVATIVGICFAWMVRRFVISMLGWVRLQDAPQSPCGHCTGCSQKGKRTLVQLTNGPKQRRS